MEAFAQGEIVLIDFPFSDRTSSKIRPALVIQRLREDRIIVPITTAVHRDKYAIPLSDQETKNALRQESLVRTDFLITCHQSLILRRIGRLQREKTRLIIDAICSMLKEEETR